MGSSKYPLEALVRLRQGSANEAARGFAAAMRERRRAETERRGAEGRREDHDRGTRAVREGERDALLRGELQVADLARADAWSLRVAAERGALTAVVGRARECEQHALSAEAESRTHLASRRGEARAVELHRERWEEHRRRAREKRDEEAAGEAWRRKG